MSPQRRPPLTYAFTFLCVACMVVATLVGVNRLSAQASPAEWMMHGIGMTAGILGLVGQRLGVAVERLTMAVVSAIIAVLCIAHVVLPTAPDALALPAALLVFATLIVTSRMFTGVLVVTVLGLVVSRLFFLGGLPDAGPEFLAIVNLTVGYSLFGGLLVILARRHERATRTLGDAIERADAARDTANRASEAKGRFLANMSHELRTPMNAVLGYAELMEEDVPQHGEVLRRIQRAGRELLEKIDTVLEFARREAEGQVLPDDFLQFEPSLTPLPTGVSSVHDPMQPLDVRWWVVRAGALMVWFTTVLNGVLVAFGHPPDLLWLVGPAAVGVFVIGLALAGLERVGVLVFLLAAAGSLLVSDLTLPQVRDLQAYGFFLMAVAAFDITPETRDRRVFMITILGLVVFQWVGHGQRVLVGWTDAASSAPWFAAPLVGFALFRVVRRRDEHRESLGRHLRDAARSLHHARRADAARDAFVAEMSHDMRTPLNAIRGYSELLGEEMAPGTDKSDLERIQAAGAHLLRIVDDILDLRRVADGDMSMQARNVEVVDLVNRAVDLTRSLIADNGNTLTVDLDGAPESVLVDPKLGLQVLVNLLSNAGKFTREGAVTIRARSHEGGVRFDVEDTGRGIAPEDLDRLFEPFERLGATNTVQGTGLGLTIAKHLAEAHGGQLTARSALGRGTTIGLWLPKRSG